MSASWGWLGAASVVLGCSGGAAPGATGDAAVHAPVLARAPELRPLVEAPRPIERIVLGPSVKELVGEVAGVAQGARLGADQRLVLPAGSELLLDFPHGARLRLFGPALARVASAQLDGLLCKEGVATLDLAPAAPTPDSGFWLATPSGRIDLVRGGRLALRVFPGGALVAAQVSGSASLSRGTGLAESRVRALLSAGELVRAGSSLVRSAGSGATLDEALSVVRSLSEQGGAEDLDRELAQQRDVVRAALERERGLVEAHRAAVRATDGGAMAAQAQLASHAALLAGERKRLRTLIDQRAAARLDRAPGQPDPLADEASALLGRAP